MFLVVTVDRNWAIGKNGRLLYNIAPDRAYFQQITAGHTVVYGRKTLETFPNSAPLENRANLILTHDQSFTCDGATIIHSIEELKEFKSDDLYIIGGASVYRQLYKQCHYAFITHIDAETPESDAFFPDLELRGWPVITETPTLEYRGIKYRFTTYLNRYLYTPMHKAQK